MFLINPYIYAAAPTPSWSPKSVAGIQLWLDAGVGVTDAGAGKVSKWDDQSGNGHYAYQNTGSAQPTLISNVLNGKSVIRFTDTTQNYMNIFNAINFPNSYSAFFVYKKLSFTNSMALIGSTGNAPTTNTIDGFIDVQNGNSVAAQAGKTGGGYTYYTKLNTAPDTYTNFVSISVTSIGSTSNIKIYKNNVSGSTYTIISGTGGIWIDLLGYHTLSTNYAQGDLAEVIIYNTYLSSTDKQNVESYLKTKYNHY